MSSYFMSIIYSIKNKPNHFNSDFKTQAIVEMLLKAYLACSKESYSSNVNLGIFGNKSCANYLPECLF